MMKLNRTFGLVTICVASSLLQGCALIERLRSEAQANAAAENAPAMAPVGGTAPAYLDIMNNLSTPDPACSDCS